MPGRHINDHQMRLYMKHRLTESVTVAAAKAPISVASAYRIENDRRLPSQKQVPRSRRRPDLLAEVFDAEVVSMLQAAPQIRTVAVFEELRRGHPEPAYGVRRTLERRIRAWRAQQGRQWEAIFRQVHEPGRVGLSDFTEMVDLGRRGGRRPARSSAVSLSPRLLGLRARARDPGRGELRGPRRGAAERTVGPRWSAARAPQRLALGSVRNLSRDARTDLTTRHEALCSHYGMEPTRVGGGENPPDSGGQTRVFEAPPAGRGNASPYEPRTAARRSRSGIKKLFGEAKRGTGKTRKRCARKSRKRVDHRKEADFDPHQQRATTAVRRTRMAR